ncbi:hypothetical protein BS78_05G036300 [Paspalum vaginatum]|nr:hypothetical protein BS78_05G036300 [Paspalum vaginatum]
MWRAWKRRWLMQVEATLLMHRHPRRLYGRRRNTGSRRPGVGPSHRAQNMPGTPPTTRDGDGGGARDAQSAPSYMDAGGTGAARGGGPRGRWPAAAARWLPTFPFLPQLGRGQGSIRGGDAEAAGEAAAGAEEEAGGGRSGGGGRRRIWPAQVASPPVVVGGTEEATAGQSA